MRSTPERADCRAIWAALELGRSRTLEDLQMIAGLEPAVSLEYLGLLIVHGYVVMPGIRRAASGEAVVQFKLARRTGPEAPYVDSNNRFVDLNVAGPASGQRPRGIYKAKVRLMAERLGGPFTQAELRNALPDPETRTKKFSGIWSNMKRAGEIVRDFTAYEDGAKCWVYRPNPHAAGIRWYFKEHLGESIQSNKLKDAVGTANGMFIRQALDVLIVEGFDVEVSPLKRDVVVYRVTRRSEAEPPGMHSQAEPGNEEIPPNPPLSKGGTNNGAGPDLPPLAKGERGGFSGSAGVPAGNESTGAEAGPTRRDGHERNAGGADHDAR